MKKVIFNIGLVAALFCAVQPSFGLTAQEGVDAYSKNDFPAALVIFEKLASEGDAFSEYNLGVFYRDGLGVARDYRKAKEFFEKAAAQGLAIAQVNLGDLYEKGNGVIQDYSKAFSWFEKGR